MEILINKVINKIRNDKGPGVNFCGNNGKGCMSSDFYFLINLFNYGAKHESNFPSSS